MGHPLAGPRDRPVGEQLLLLGRAVLSPPQTAKGPVFCPLAQTGSQRIPLDVSQDGQQVLILLNGKRLEPSLVEVAGSLGAVMGVPPHGVRVSQPAEEVRELRVGLGPYDEVPVIWHDRVREDGQPLAGDRFFQNLFEGLVVFGFLEQREPRNSPVQHMKARSGRTNSRSSWHASSVT